MLEAIYDNNFEEVTKEGLVLIDFWATWCPPCRMQAPILENLAEEYEDRVKIVKMDVDENEVTPKQFDIMSIPTMILKKDGEVVETLVGLHQKPQLEQIFARYL